MPAARRASASDPHDAHPHECGRLCHNGIEGRPALHDAADRDVDVDMPLKHAQSSARGVKQTREQERETRARRDELVRAAIVTEGSAVSHISIISITHDSY